MVPFQTSWLPFKYLNSHEDIRESLISVVHLLRLTEDKLERHEFREKALGDHVKKQLLGLERKHRALEPMKGTISRMDERLSNVETVLMQVVDDFKFIFLDIDIPSFLIAPL